MQGLIEIVNSGKKQNENPIVQGLAQPCKWSLGQSDGAERRRKRWKSRKRRGEEEEEEE